MLKQDQIKMIAGLLKLDAAALANAIKDEKEIDVTLPKEGQLLTASDLESRDKNIKSTGYNEGVSAGQEMLIKNLKQTHGLTFDGKDPEMFVNEFKTKILADAKLQPGEALKEKDLVIKNLQTNVATLTAEKQQIETKHKEYQLNGSLIREVPQLGVALEPDEVISSMKRKGYAFEADQNGVLLTKLNGQIVRDATTQNPIAVKDVIGGYVKERKWDKPEAEQPRGRGAGNSAPVNTGNIRSLSAAQKAWEAEGKNANSADFAAQVQKLAKENTDFDMNS